MFRNSYQNGLLTIFYSCGANPLAIWDMEVKNGHIKRLTDNEVNSIVLEIVSTNVATTFISCPKNDQVLGIKLPFLVMIIKNLKRYFTFEITVLDDRHMRRRFRISNFQSTTKIKPFCTTMPIALSGGWNQIQFNLADFTRRAYGSQLIETLRVQVHANARVRRIYFSERLYTEEELPQEYKLYLPLERKAKKGKEKDKAQKKEEEPAAAAPGAVSEEEEAPPPPAKEVKSRLSRKSKLGGTSSKKIKGLAEEEAPVEGEAVAGEEEIESAAEGEQVAEGEEPAEGEATVKDEGRGEGEEPAEGATHGDPEGEAPIKVEAPEEVAAPEADEMPAAGEAAPPAEEAPPPAEEAPAETAEPESAPPAENEPVEAAEAEE